MANETVTEGKSKTFLNRSRVITRVYTDIRGYKRG